MRRIREILRLRFEQGASVRTIATSCRVSKTTVSEILARAQSAGIGWPLPEDLDEEALVARLYPEPATPTRRRPIPDWTSIDRELRRKGVTLQTLWSEYHQQHPDGYRYARFCQLYRAWKRQQDVVLRQVYKAGEKMFVDFAGMTIPIQDPKTGAVSQAYLFVATLGASSYTFAKAVPAQDRFWWLMAHVEALEFFGGVPALIVPDNPKTGVTHACYYDPELNPAYQEFAEHYGVAILPARPKKPRDKAKVESAVPFAERFILARLRHQTFFSVAEANAAIRPLLEELNHRPFQKREGSRASLFAELERPALRPLPVRRYEYAEWKRLRVNIDSHVEVAGCFYSVPYQYAQQEVRVRVSAHTVEIFSGGRRIASHPRLTRKGEVSTLEAHMPDAHRRYRQAPSLLLAEAQAIGPHTKALVEALLATHPHPEQGYRAGQGVVRLTRRYGADRLEAACQRALATGALAYRSVQNILRCGLDRIPYHPPAEEEPLREHAHLRGPAYYRSSGGEA